MRAERRLAAGLAALTVVAVLLPMAGGLAGGGLFPEFSQPWSLISSGLENSAVLTLATVLGTLVLASPAAYALARGRWRLRPALFALVLVAMAVPGALLILPQYKEIFWLGLLNTRVGLVLLYVATDLPLAVLFMRAAFASVPDQLVESMRVDGAPALRIFTRLFLPLSASTIITVVVFVVIQVWNEQLLAGALLDTSSLYPFPVLVALDVGGTASLSASWISLAPPLFVFVVFQRWFQRGMLPGPLI
jgi:ABC-type glycerol-3-phosphate transport system permease component